MKKIKKFLNIIMILILMVISSKEVFGQYSVSSITTRMTNMGWKKVDDRYAFLKEGVATSWWLRTFYANMEYAVVAFSNDEDVDDVDVEVAYPDGTIYESDTKSNALAIVTFTPSRYRNLKIRMKNASSDTPDYASECHYLVFYR